MQSTSKLIPRPSPAVVKLRSPSEPIQGFNAIPVHDPMSERAESVVARDSSLTFLCSWSLIRGSRQDEKAITNAISATVR